MPRAPSSATWSAASTWPGPASGTVDVWRIALDQPPASGDVLSAEERSRAARLRQPDLRRRFEHARAALRTLLGRYAGRDPAALELGVGAYGKPVLPGSSLSFNLSHSGDLALLAVAPGALPLGVDVEEASSARPLDRLAHRFFSPAEASGYALLPASERAAMFYRLWTRKEAYLKAWGTGLTFSSRRFSVRLDPGSGTLLSHTEMPGDDDASGWWFEELAPGPGFAAAVCWRGPRRPVRRLVHR